MLTRPWLQAYQPRVHRDEDKDDHVHEPLYSEQPASPSHPHGFITDPDLIAVRIAAAIAYKPRSITELGLLKSSGSCEEVLVKIERAQCDKHPGNANEDAEHG